MTVDEIRCLMISIWVACLDAKEILTTDTQKVMHSAY